VDNTSEPARDRPGVRSADETPGVAAGYGYFASFFHSYGWTSISGKK
jgi:hypothetical protein